jgi:signal transduction histidine kinase
MRRAMLKRIENLPLMMKAVVPIAVMLAAALGIVALAEHSLATVTAKTHEIIRVTATRQAQALVAAASANGVAANEKNAMLMTDKSGLDVFASAYVTDMDHLKDSIATLAKLPADAAEADRLARIGRAIDAYNDTGAQLYQFMVDRQFEQAHALSNGAAQVARERLLGLIDEEVAHSTAQMQEAEGQADVEYRQMVALLAGMSLGGLFIAILMAGWITRRFIIGPLTAIAASVGRLSRGDLTVAIDGDDRRDEIGVLGRAVVLFRDQSLALRDNSERLNAAHREIREMNLVLERRVEERTTELKAAHRDLLRNERLTTLGQLTATVAHELRNPLSAIRNTFVVIEDATTQAGLSLARPLARVERSIDRCDAIIDDLLDYARNRELTRTDAVGDDWLAAVLRGMAVPATVRLMTNLGAPNCDIAIDQERMRRVMVNLVENAAQAMTDPSFDGAERKILVSTEATSTHYALIVADTGPGIAPDHLAKIFEPFFSTKSFGTGLGLPTVKQIVEQHGGRIDIASEANSGARFTILLPRQALGEQAA